jgi:hypothetical protein
MYYARNPVRLTFEDADWGTLTDDEVPESEQEQEQTPHALVPTKSFLRPKLVEVSTLHRQGFRKSPASASGTSAEAKPGEKELNRGQQQHSIQVPGTFT